MIVRNPKPRGWLTYLGAWTSALAFLSSQHALAENPKGAGWISGDAVAYVEIARPSEILERLTTDPVKGLVETSPNFQKYVGSDGYRQTRAVVDLIAGSLHSTWKETLLDMVGGGVILAIEPGMPPRAILIATPRDPSVLLKAQETLFRLARTDALAKGQPDPIKSIEHRGLKGYLLGPKSAYAIVDGALVVGESAETLKLVIDRALDTPEPSRMLPGDPLWQARRKAQDGDRSSAWGLVRIDRLRKLDPNALKVPDQINPLFTLLFGDWFEAARKAPWASVSLRWTSDHLGASLALATPEGGYSDTFQRFLPAKGKGAPGLLLPKGTIASLGLWRDLSSLWEVRSDLFSPEAVQGFAQLDTLAGTFFGGRDFGTGVLGALGTDWRVVVVRQDVSKLDPVPDDKLPAFALIADLKPDDEEFAIRLKAAFQSFIGLANLNSGQTKAPPLMLSMETCDGIAVSTSKFLKPKMKPQAGETVHSRYNFSPSIAQVGDHFILSSSLSLVRDLIPTLKNPPKATDATLLLQADGGELAALIQDNAAKLVMQNMLEKGNDKPRAESEIGLLVRIVRTLGQGKFSATDQADAVRFQVDFATHQ